jgi:lipoprotein-releasing system permease protein
MGIESDITTTYPVKMKVSDFLMTGAMLVVSTTLIALYPARKAAKTFSVEHL